MPLIRSDGEYGSVLTDRLRIIPEAHLKTVCQIGCGVKTCRYISSVAQGFTCVKNSPLQSIIDKEVRTKPQWKAKGNNCDGFGTHYGKAKHKSQSGKIQAETGKQKDKP